MSRSDTRVEGCDGLSEVDPVIDVKLLAGSGGGRHRGNVGSGRVPGSTAEAEPPGANFKGSLPPRGSRQGKAANVLKTSTHSRVKGLQGRGMERGRSGPGRVHDLAEGGAVPQQKKGRLGIGYISEGIQQVACFVYTLGLGMLTTEAWASNSGPKQSKLPMLADKPGGKAPEVSTADNNNFGLGGLKDKAYLLGGHGEGVEGGSDLGTGPGKHNIIKVSKTEVQVASGSGSLKARMQSKGEEDGASTPQLDSTVQCPKQRWELRE